MSFFDRPLGALLVLSLFAPAACNDPILDTTRKTDPRGTLGEEIFKLLDKDLKNDDARRAQGFEMEHDDFVGAIDHIFPPEELHYTETFLEKLLPLYDNGTIPGATRMLAASLDRLSKNNDALKSLAAIDHRIGYVDRSHEQALIRRIAHSKSYRPLMKAMLKLALDHDGLDDQGNADPNENDSMTRLLASFAKQLRELELSDDAERQVVLLTDLVMHEDPLFSADAGAQSPSGPPSLPGPMNGQTAQGSIVARDPRGMAQVMTSNGQVVAPFVDLNPHDGLADVNVLGQFVDASGNAIDLPPFGQTSSYGMRDVAGRAIGPDGNPLFQYSNLDRTMMAGLLRDSRKLISDGIPMKAVRTLDNVLGQRTAAGPYPADNGILDMAHAIGACGDIHELPQLFELFRILLRDHEATLGWVDVETQATLDISDNYNVALKPGNTFFDDLMSVVRKILREPGLAEDLLVALQDPVIANLPDVQVKLMSTKKDKLSIDDVNNGTMFDTPVDRTMPDVRGNQSTMQRTMHLIHDTRGASYQPSLIGIPLGFIFKIDDQAEFYLESIIGKASVPSLVASLTGLSTSPSPQELADFLNKDQMFGNPKGNEGFDVKDNDGDTLFAVSHSGLSDILKPLIQVFYDHGQMGLLFELFDVLHMHWASARSGDYQDRDPSMPRYSKLSGIRDYEPLLIDQFQHSKTLDAVRKLLSETQDVILSNQEKAHDLLLTFARKFFDKDSSLKGRDGKHEAIFDGQRVTPLSPFDLIRAARSRLKNTVKRTQMAQSDWDALIDALNQTLLKIDRTGPESGALKNPRAKPVAMLLLQFLEERAQKHVTIGDTTRWVTQQFEQNIQDAVTSPNLPPLFDVVYAIDGDQEISQRIADLRDELFAEDQGFQDLLVVAGDMLESAKDASMAVPFLKYVGQEIDPDKKLMFTMLSLEKKSLDIDADEHMLEVIRRSIDDSPAGDFFAEGLGRAIRQPNRVNPLSTDVVTGEDILKIAGVVAKYMLDDQHGLEKFYDLVSKRK